MWFEKWPKPQLFEMQEAEGEVGSPIVVDWCFTVFEEASAVIGFVVGMRGLSKAWVILYGCFQATCCISSACYCVFVLGHMDGSFCYVVGGGGVCPNLVQTKKSPQPMRAEALGSEVKCGELGKATAQND